MQRSVRRIVMLGYPAAQILDITGPLEVFARTSRWLRDHRRLTYDAYPVQLVSPRAGWFDSSGGLRLQAACSYFKANKAHTLLIPTASAIATSSTIVRC